MSSPDLNVRHVARLARIALAEEEVTTFQEQLGRVLEHVEHLSKLDVSGVEPTAHTYPIFNVTRQDMSARQHAPRSGSEPRAAHRQRPGHRSESRRMMDLARLTASEIQEGFRAKAFHPVDLLRALESRIQAVDPAVQAFLSRDFEAALRKAETADVSLPLGGIPIGIKDVINVKGDPCTCASRILQGYTAPYDATVIARLRAAGAIPFGRLNMDEFAMGSSTENSAFQTTRNPWDTTRIPGGSSGGSAAAVAACEVPAALGSDTGGSIRQPAALCGCVGLKPSYGRVSRYGLVAFASSLDQIGPVARSTRDCALLLNAIAGPDPMDSTSLDQPAEDFTAKLGRDLKGVRLGIPKEYFVDGMDARVRSTVEAAIQQCAEHGAELVELSLPHTEYAVSVYYIIATAEASANLARFDGVRYGRRVKPAQGSHGPVCSQS